MDSHYDIRPIASADIPLLVGLMEACFGPGYGEDFFRWKYWQNPAGPVRGWMAFAPDGEAAAYYGVIPQRYIVGGDERTVFQSGDTMTHPAHRRRGLFERLATHCYDALRAEGQLFVLGFGGKMSTAGLEKMGWRHVATTHQLFLPRQLALLRRSRSAPVYAVEDFSSIAHLLEKSNRQAEVHSHKTPELVAWRIANPLYAPVVIHSIGPDGQPDGYLIYYEHKGRIYLFDGYFESGSSRKALLGAVFSRLRRYASLQGALALCSSGSHLYKALRQSGFLKSPFRKGRYSLRMPLMMLAPEGEMDRWAHSRFWAVTAYDHDTM